MSKQAAVDFFAKADADAALQQEIITATKGKEDKSMLVDAARSLVEVGAKHGYNFTVEEAVKTYLELQGKAVLVEEEGEGEELSDDSLELVAGGIYRVKPSF